MPLGVYCQFAVVALPAPIEPADRPYTPARNALPAMCTLIAIHRTVSGAPLVVAANRDEFLDRPSEGPSVRETPGGPVMAPRDARAGGTWLGINSTGVFAGVTNRRGKPQDPSLRTRGSLVFEALAAETAKDGAEIITRVPEDSYNAFNFFIADADDAFVITYDARPELRELAPGPHLVGNVEPDDRREPKVDRLMERAEEAAKCDRENVLDELSSVCREHDCAGGPLDDTCVHTPLYGTRSSCLYLQGESPREDHFLYSEGAPCAQPYQDLTALLPEPSRRAGYGSREQLSRRVI